MKKAYLEITLKIDNADRTSATAIYNKYKTVFLETIEGALSKELLIHTENAQAYLLSELFNNDVVIALKPYLRDQPNVKIYETA
ncbi:hypothetical protein [Pseudopedobacter sp.]|uniref:hypothetical protein n=1 Tax=Pseudopedobacter sp. TaxID=1936787 RepID=UPI00333F5C02